MKKSLSVIFGLFLLILVGCGQEGVKEVNRPIDGQILNNTGQEEAVREIDVDLKKKVKEAVKDSVEAVEEAAADIKNEEAEDWPETFDQDMVFSRQAPFGKWEIDFYQDACEEASLIMVDKFFKGLPLDEAIMKTELDKIEPWELARFGENLSVNIEQVAIMAREYFGLDAEVSSEVTVERIKKEIAAGNLVILPLTGREIGNPNFTDEGPLYHMLVIKGYDRDQFITNDPGTIKGKDYKYKYDVLIQATHDWNEGDIYNGKRLMIIVSKGLTN